jgi:diacylglycerol kinase (ATP)
MGLAPAGRCNDFARALGVPNDPKAIAEVLMRGTPCPIDLGRVNGRCFCTVATLGVDAEVSSYVDTMRMPLRGTLAYLYGALRVLARYRPHRVRIDGDFGVIDQPIFLASTANTSLYGGAIRIAPEACPTDGVLDLCIIEGVSRLRSWTMLPSVLRGQHQSCPEVRFVRTRRLAINASEPLELWADGERTARTPVEIQAAPGAVHILLPPLRVAADPGGGRDK